MKIKHFEEGITSIRKGMIDRDTDLVIFPKSIKEIEDGACVLDEHSPYSFFFIGTEKEWEKVKVGENNTILTINFLSGRHICHI